MTYFRNGISIQFDAKIVLLFLIIRYKQKIEKKSYLFLLVDRLHPKKSDSILESEQKLYFVNPNCHGVLVLSLGINNYKETYCKQKKNSFNGSLLEYNLSLANNSFSLA